MTPAYEREVLAVRAAAVRESVAAMRKRVADPIVAYQLKSLDYWCEWCVRHFAAKSDPARK